MIGENILHYKIIEKLGEGGMGEVYKAQDTKLDRFVALKFLPSQLTATEDAKARFIQEAKAASSMNHPNVCTIYDIQEYEGQLFIVMEFIDGKTLKEKKDHLSEKQILEIGIQTAEGLAAAHEKGIVHRDIKPENIMIRKDGIVQIMDFGLAKLFAPGDASRLTRMGTTMGTMGYMSPEQVQGLDVDHRSDIFSLGVVLYELLSKESPFKGMHETAIMYEIVNVDAPPISAIKPDIDPMLEGIILECLEKEKDERCQSAKELAKDLRKIKRVSTGNRASRIYNVNTNSFNVKSTDTQTYSTSPKSSIGEMQVKNLFRNIFYNPKIFWSSTALLSIAVIALLIFSVFNKTDEVILETKATILPPQNVSLNNKIGSNLTISPDGKYISFVGADSTGTLKLWVRPINSLIARPLTIVSDEAYPFWSPDGKEIAYFDKNKLMKISLDAGTSLPICDIVSGRGGSWSPNGTIILTPEPIGGIVKVPSSGGKPDVIIKPDTSIKIQSLRWAHFLPDGEHFLYSSENSASGSTPTDGIYLSSLSDLKSEKIINASSNCQYANGYLLFVRQSILLAQKFNPGSLKLEGEAIPVAENVQYYDTRISGTFAVSANSKLVYIEQNQNSEMTVLLDKNGNVIKKLLDQKVQISARFSPDGSKIAYDFYDPGQKNIDIWTLDLNRNVSTRLSFSQSPDILPTWSPDGKQISYGSNQNASVYDSFIKNADGSGSPEILFKSDYSKVVSDFSSDGKYLLYSAVSYASNKSVWDIFVLPRKENAKPVTILATDFSERAGTFSPNMKWIAYQSDESGKDQIYIIPFNPSANSAERSGKWQISTEGGTFPKWMDNGKKIYFFMGDKSIMAVDVNENGYSLSPSKPYIIFKQSNRNISQLFDINKDGTEIIATIPNGQTIQPPITLVENWQVDLEGKK